MFLRPTILWSALALLLLSCATPPSPLPQGEKGATFSEPDLLGPDKWPTNVQDTVVDILSQMSEENKKRIRETKRKDLIRFHHGWGTGIRNYYGLRRGNQKLIESACGRPCDPDDASMVIINAVWSELQK